MRPSVLIAFGAVIVLTACERPMEARSASAATSVPPAASTPPQPDLHWNPGDLQGLAKTSAGCAARTLNRHDQEADALAKLKRASRSGKVLTVGKVRFEDEQKDPENASQVSYRYLGAYGDSGVDAVLAEYYEGAGVVLVDQRNGAKLAFIDLPIVSQDGRFFAAVSTSEHHGDRLQIVERTPAGWVERARYDEAVVHSPCGLVWESDTALAVQARWPTSEPGDDVEWSPQVAAAWGPARVVRAAGAWRFEAPRR